MGEKKSGEGSDDSRRSLSVTGKAPADKTETPRRGGACAGSLLRPILPPGVSSPA